MQSRVDRAKQFMPFDALQGFRETVNLLSKKVDVKKEFSNDYLDILSIKLSNIKKGDKVLIKYYYLTEYIETIDVIKKIDNIYKMIILNKSNIYFDDILDINKL